MSCCLISIGAVNVCCHSACLAVLDTVAADTARPLLGVFSLPNPRGESRQAAATPHLSMPVLDLVMTDTPLALRPLMDVTLPGSL